MHDVMRAVSVRFQQLKVSLDMKRNANMQYVYIACCRSAIAIIRKGTSSEFVLCGRHCPLE